MRIIAGSARRRTIQVPKSVLRPTTDRTREALFSMLHEVVKDADCLDLFAGSGALGMEALSRGAKSCTFVDQERLSIRSIEANLKELKLHGGSVRVGDATELNAYADASFDVIFADPPYVKKEADRDFVEDLLSRDLSRILRSGGFFIAEAPAGRVTAPTLGWSIVSERTYGSCGITVYKKE